MIDRSGRTEQVGDAVVSGDVGRDGGGAYLFRRGLQALGVARGNDNVGARALGDLGGRQTDAG